MVDIGKTKAQAIQDAADGMTSSELWASVEYIPLFSKACEVESMLTRKIGTVVKTLAGNVCKLLQNYDDKIFTGEPETLLAQWGFKWSKDPTLAKDFISDANSTYAIDECCIGSDGVTYASTIDNNVFDPVVNPQYWRVAT